MRRHIIYIVPVCLLFAVLTIVFTCMGRSRFSELENRKLADFPEFNMQKLADGSFAGEVSHWFNDTEPFREEFMQLNMNIKKQMGLPRTEESATFHAAAQPKPRAVVPGPASAMDEKQFEGDNMEDEYAKLADRGILVVGTGSKVRALMLYGGSARSGSSYADAPNRYKREFGDDVNVYCAIIPTSVEFYCPKNFRKHSNPQLPTIKNIYSHLSDSVRPVNVYHALTEHAHEDIFLRTDHHWAALGAYYAAREIARTAGVPLPDISKYEKHVVKDFVGTMYGYSKDITVKNAPEDFVYYTPTGITYTTEYRNYTLDKKGKVKSEGKPYTDKFFYHFRDGSGGAYSTFMGSDMKLTKVTTSTHNGRKILIFKDSFGNAIPGWLFGSFQEVHVVDCRYFTRNIKTYVRDNGITDILFTNNVFKACSDDLPKTYNRFLNWAT